MLTKVIAGSSFRKTRFHDQKNQRVSASRAVRNGSRALATNILRVTFGVRPLQPWISYDAVRIIDKFLNGQSRVLEFGSGMSTAWYAERAGHVTSLENYRPWYDQVTKLFKSRGIDNVDYVFAGSADEYVTIPDAELGFDLIMVDGSDRDRCTKVALPMLKPGGLFYLDNSDRAGDPSTQEHRAETMALEYAKGNGSSVTYITDFAPTQFFAGEGLMLRRPA